MMKEYSNFLYSAGRAKGTVSIRVQHIEQLSRRHSDVLRCTQKDLEEYLAIRRFTLKAETRKTIRSSFRTFYAWAYATDRTTTDPAYALPPIRIPQTIPRIAPDAEVEIALLSATLEERAMILLGRLGALRLSEIASLHTKHREYDLLRITGKGEKQRMVPINDDLMHVLLDLEEERDGSGFYFPGRWGGHMHPQSVNKIITRRLGMNPHSLRHAAATSAFNGTHDIRAVQEFLGHSSMATTERYLHMDLESVRRVARATALPRNRHLSIVSEVIPISQPPGKSA